MNERYFANMVEEFWSGQREDVHVGRIEIFEQDGKYAIYEARFVIPIDPPEIYDYFRQAFDFMKFDVMPRIIWDYTEVK